MTEEKCGHINKHSHDEYGKLDDLACDLEQGHGGDHSAMHFERATKFSEALTQKEAEKFIYMMACPTCKKFKVGGAYCPDCLTAFPENTPHYYEGEIRREWNDAAGTLASEIVPISPGIEVISSDHMFPQLQQEKMQEMERRMAELEGKLKDSSEEDEGEK